MKVAVDAMGGDYAPAEVVSGALLVAAERSEVQIILVGDEAAIAAELAKVGDIPAGISVRHASEAIEMHEHPAAAIRRKRNSSLVICGQLVRSGEVDATISAGNTGAAMAIALVDIGRIPGIGRPAIAATLPTSKAPVLLVDAGANVDCSVENLLQFALVGSIFADKVMGVPSPRVGLLNIGGEAGKGNELSKETYSRLQDAALNFIGNVEGKDVFDGSADVVVCDGFVGNVLLKSAEGVAEMLVGALQEEFAAMPGDSRDLFGPMLRRVKNRFDYAEYGGAPLLGVNGVSVISHGRSHAKAIAAAIRVAARSAERDVVGTIRNTLKGASEAAQ